MLVYTLIRAQLDAIRQDRGVWLALTYLASRDDGERWLYDSFWSALTIENPETRTAIIFESRNAIGLRFSRTQK